MHILFSYAEKKAGSVWGLFICTANLDQIGISVGLKMMMLALRLRWTILGLWHSTEGKPVEPHIFPRKINKNVTLISVFL